MNLENGKFPTFKNIVDIHLLEKLFESFTAATGFTTGLIDQSDMEILIGTGWRKICTDFHRGNKASACHCRESNIELTATLNTPGEIRIVHCRNGLVDGATPIVIEGRHLATLVTGQVRFSEPDPVFFRKQAETFGYDVEKYLDALWQVPVVNEEKFRNMLAFLAQMATTVAEIGLAKLKSQQDYEHIKEIEEKLSAEHERLLVTLRSIDEGMIATNLDDEITLMNQVAEKLTGFPQEKALGEKLSQVLRIEGEGGLAHDSLRQASSMSNNVFRKHYVKLVSATGERYLIENAIAPLRNRQSEVIGKVIVFRDVTEEKKMEEELSKIRKIESLGVLAGGIAHDFNNILAAIMGNIELAQRTLHDPDRLDSLLDTAIKAGSRARKLTQQLLTFSKGGDPVRKASQIGEIVTESASFILHGTRTDCNFEIPGDLWSVEVDSGQISQVIQNIVLNASQAMPGGGTVSIRCENVSIQPGNSLFLKDCNEKYVKITIRDSGVGIPEEHLDRIFDPYFTTKSSGHGLGMAICLSIINRHNGRLEVKSEVGKGTTFTIYLPAIDRDSSNEGEHANTEDVELRGARALLMDDDEMLLRVLEGFLKLLGVRSVLTSDGSEAIREYERSLMEKRPFDLVFLDVTVPGGMGGVETVRKILELDSDANVVVVSGYSNDRVMSDYRDYGFRMAVPKPFRISDIENAVKGLVANGRKAQDQ